MNIFLKAYNSYNKNKFKTHELRNIPHCPSPSTKVEHKCNIPHHKLYNCKYLSLILGL